MSDWLGGMQTTPRKTPNYFIILALALLALALALLALALAQRTNAERLTYGNTKENMGAVEMRRCRRSGDLLGSRSCWESQQLLLKPSPTPGSSSRGLRVAVYAVKWFAACQ